MPDGGSHFSVHWTPTFPAAVGVSIRARLLNVFHLETIVNRPSLSSRLYCVCGGGVAVYITPKEKREKAPDAPAQRKVEKNPTREDMGDNMRATSRTKKTPNEKNSLDVLPKSTFNLKGWNAWRRRLARVVPRKFVLFFRF